MAVFRYRFQNILNIKKSMEEQEKLRFSEAKNRLAAEEQKLEELIKRRETYREEAVRIRMNAISVRDLEENHEALERLDEYVKAQEISVKKAEEAVDEAAVRLQNAMKERKMHEKLKETAVNEFLAAENISEGKTTDEMVSYVYSEKKEQ